MATGPRKLFDRIAQLPPAWHLVPYGLAALTALVMFLPGVVPHGNGDCDAVVNAAPGAHAFNVWSAVVFGLLELLFIVSATLARRQRSGRVGWLSRGLGVLFAGIALSAMIAPNSGAALPAELIMFGAAFAAAPPLTLLPVLIAVIWSWNLSGSRAMKLAQVVGWLTVLFLLPICAAEAYLTVTPWVDCS